MNQVLEVFKIAVFLTLFSHALFLSMHNELRIKKVLWYLDLFKKNREISDKDYKFLYDRYAGFFNYLEFYPDKEDFKALYQNSDFARYVNRSKWKIKYCAIVIAVSILILILIVPKDIR